MRVLSIWIGGAGAGHDETCFFTSANDGLRTSVQRIEGNEVSALRTGPGTDSKAAQFSLQNLDYGFELRSHDVCMLSHVLHHAVDISEETHVTQLVYLVMADGLDL